MFIWKKEYELGIKIIDDQHKNIFEIGRKLEKLIIGYTDDNIFDDLQILLNELIDYTIYHFSTEEYILRKAEYADYENHKEKHDQFTNKLEHLDLTNMKHNQGAFAFTLLQMISTWIFEHITGDDALYQSTVLNASETIRNPE